MVLDLKGAFDCEGYRRDFVFAFDLSGSDEAFAEPVRVSGSVCNRAGLVTLEAAAEADYSTVCDRCCIPVREHYSVRISNVLVRSLAGNSEDTNGENDDLLPVPEEKLDLAELAAADVMLALPMKHLCSEGCKGLCPVCGRNLNEGPCACGHEPNKRF